MLLVGLTVLFLGRQLLGWIKTRDAAALTVFVSGCDSGFGKALMERLSKSGSHVIAGCYTVKGQVYASKLPGVSALSLDVTDTESIAAAASFVAETVGEAGLDGLVNNAGVCDQFPLEFLAEDKMRTMFEVNTFGAWRLTRAMLPHLRRAKDPRLVNLSSILGRVSSPGLDAYSASKHAMEGFSDAWRMELAGKIRVVLVEPGMMQTGLFDRVLGNSLARAYEKAPSHARLHSPFAELQEQRNVSYLAIRYLAGRPESVVSALDRALRSWWPLPRYVVGYDATLIALFNMFPSCVNDTLGYVLFAALGFLARHFPTVNPTRKHR